MKVVLNFTQCLPDILLFPVKELAVTWTLKEVRISEARSVRRSFKVAVKVSRSRYIASPAMTRSFAIGGGPRRPLDAASMARPPSTGFTARYPPKAKIV